MSKTDMEDLNPTPLHAILAGLFACFASVVAVMGWSEAIQLDVTRSIVFARPGQPIETGWQPIAVGIFSITIGASVALGVIRRGFSDPRSRVFLALLCFGMLAWATFGAAAIYAGIEAFELLEQKESRGSR